MKRIQRILLATPPYHAGVLESAGIWPPLGLISIAGELRRYGFDVVIYDCMSMQHTLEEAREFLRGASYDLIGVSSITASINAALDLLRISREEHPAAVNLLGNVHPTFQYGELFERHPHVIDFIIRGEGEVTMPRLCETINAGGDLFSVAGVVLKSGGRVHVAEGREFVADLNELQPAWDLLDWSLYKFFVMPGSRLGIINSSRGCPHACSFCSQQKFWQRSYRELAPERFLDQICEMKERHGVTVVMLSDEYPTRNRDRWERILDLLIARETGVALLLETRVEDILRDADILWKYRRAEILHIYVGVEATNQASLDLFKKDIKCEQSQEALRLIAANGMISECSFVLGMPDETPETIATTLELAKHYNPDFAHFLAIAPWPYSDLYEDVREHIREFDYAKYNLITPVVQPRCMTLEEVNEAILQCYREYYMWKIPAYLSDPDPFRRDYLLRSTRVMMHNSFLRKQMQGSMPPQIKAYLEQTHAGGRPASGRTIGI